MADGDRKSCRGCSEKCMRTHFNGHGSSFFKVMAAEFPSLLEIPSGFLKQSQIKGCRDAILEGPSGYLWHARVYCYNKLSYFKEGWEIFVSDHCIQPTDIIVFRHVNDAHFLVQIFEASGYEKKNTFTVKYCESHKLNKLDMDCTDSTTFGQRPKENPLKYASVDNKNAQKRITRSTGLKVEITGSCAEARISHTRPLSTKKHEFLGHPKINVKHGLGLPQSKWQFSENQVGSCANHPIILESEDDFDTQASSANSPDQVTDEVSYHSNSEVLQEKVSYLKEDHSVKKGKPTFTKVINKSAITHSFWLSIPIRFGRRWFPQGRVDVLLSHQKRTWEVSFVGERGTCGLGPGWKYFAIDNELKVGETCIFELEDKVNHILKVHIRR